MIKPQGWITTEALDAVKRLGWVVGCICRYDVHDPSRARRITAMGCPVHEGPFAKGALSPEFAEAASGARPLAGKFPDTSLRTVAELDSCDGVSAGCDPGNDPALAQPPLGWERFNWRTGPKISGQFGNPLPSGPLVRAFPDPGEPHRVVLSSAGVALSLDAPMLRAIMSAAEDGIAMIAANAQ